jgi:hypothetical protein
LQEAPRGQSRIAHQPRRRYLSRTFAAAHQAGHFIHFHEPVHPAAQSVLIAMLARTEFPVAAYS